MQVRGDPRTVLKLRCLFIKMRSLLEVPLLRLGQARAPAVAATSRVYSSALLAFSRRLLQVSQPEPLQILHSVLLHQKWIWHSCSVQGQA